MEEVGLFSFNPLVSSRHCTKVLLDPFIVYTISFLVSPSLRTFSSLDDFPFLADHNLGREPSQSLFNLPLLLIKHHTTLSISI